MALTLSLIALSVQANMHLEDEVKKVNVYKNQAEDFKKKLIETQHNLSQETQKRKFIFFLVFEVQCI
jgi:hypothetical protein